MSLKYLALISSIRESRLADRMLSLLQTKFDAVLAPRGHSLQVLDPRVYDLPLLKKPLHFYGNKEQHIIPENLIRLNELVKAADVYVVLLTEYNRCAPPALYNTLDHLPPASFAYKSSGIFGYSMGPSGASFATASVRPLLTEMGCLPVKHSVQVPLAHTVVNDDGSCTNPLVLKSIDELFAQTEWWGKQAKEGRAKGLPSF
ncbi:NADPH azoreductase [Hydra vulgaris]|uniref:NADPH azoreductase n=1 Tax=Hydra vulgaris TaxID=6087 RepID=UPI0001924DA4|nr:NADPH azoreductase [Hydra vulgaris]XP_012558127.1 NADPH azoreductase [Hydra vulgaris]XP_012558128.1 NADPH azoreductase [Hydra vulgaris]XP_047145944.1 NADPH azoreductase [Hydra vulgaris]